MQDCTIAIQPLAFFCSLTELAHIAPALEAQNSIEDRTRTPLYRLRLS